MKLSINEQFHNFLMRHNLTISYIQEMITEYANTIPELARTHFTQKFSISEHVFYRCLDFAVICCLVDDRICRFLYGKACENSRTHNKENSARASAKHFDELLSKREEYILSFSEAEIRDIARKYAGGMSAEKIALAYETGKYGINRLLVRGIKELVIDKKTLDTIIHIMPGTKNSINACLRSRQKEINQLLSAQSSDIKILEFKIYHYSLYFKEESENPSITELEKQLMLAKKRYERTLKL